MTDAESHRPYLRPLETREERRTLERVAVLVREAAARVVLRGVSSFSVSSHSLTAGDGGGAARANFISSALGWWLGGELRRVVERGRQREEAGDGGS